MIVLDPPLRSCSLTSLIIETFVHVLMQGLTAIMCGRVERRPEREAEFRDRELLVGINTVVD
jgi:hypothetical protein